MWGGWGGLCGGGGALVIRHAEGGAQRQRQRCAEAGEGGGQRVGQPRGGELRAEQRQLRVYARGEGEALLLELGEAFDPFETGELPLGGEGLGDPTELLRAVDELLGERCEVVDTRHARIRLRRRQQARQG